VHLCSGDEQLAEAQGHWWHQAVDMPRNDKLRENPHTVYFLEFKDCPAADNLVFVMASYCPMTKFNDYHGLASQPNAAICTSKYKSTVTGKTHWTLRAVIKTNGPIKAGQQILVDYGKHNLTKMLLEVMRDSCMGVCVYKCVCVYMCAYEFAYV
jgi:hypothetical protein